MRKKIQKQQHSYLQKQMQEYIELPFYIYMGIQQPHCLWLVLCKQKAGECSALGISRLH